MGIVGYHEKRQKSDLENEIEASMNDTAKKNNLTEAYNTKYSGGKPTRQHHIHKNHEFEIGERVDHGLASDFEGNFT